MKTTSTFRAARRRERAKAAGLCTKCVRRPPLEGRERCASCYEETRVYNVVRNRKLGPALSTFRRVEPAEGCLSSWVIE
jgi:hypothetical protein